VLWLFDHPLELFGATLVLLWGAAQAGVWAGVRRPLTSKNRAEFDLVRSAMLTLLGLLVAFAISMAVARYDQRKAYEEAEANAIGTEYLRLDHLPQESAAAARALLRTYANERIAFYSDPDRPLSNDAETARTQAALWASVLPEAKAHPTQITALVVAGMNDVINSQGYALAAWRDRLPMEVWALLILVAAACNLLIGFGADRLSPATQAILPLTAALAFVLIADVEGPRNGLVQVDPINLRDAAEAMRETPGAFGAEKTITQGGQ
jgi:hypothetical protein